MVGIEKNPETSGQLLEKAICHGHWVSLNVLAEYVRNESPGLFSLQFIPTELSLEQTLEDEVTYLSGQKAGLLLLNIKAINPPRSGSSPVL